MESWELLDCADTPREPEDDDDSGSG